jgi:hypothetical protein
MIDTAYFQDTFSALVKALYYERGRGAYFRATMVGRDYIDRQEILGDTSEEVIENCIGFLMKNEIIRNAAYKKDASDTFFTFEIKGCAHLPVEARLKEEGVPAFVCPPVNIILYKIRQRIGLAVEIADITVHKDTCIVRVVIFKQDEDHEKGR